MRVVAIAMAGSVGAVARYGVGVAIGARSFPWATLAINVAGSFLLGVVLAAQVSERWNATVIAAVAVGFLGAFTTFSTFSYETTSMIRAGRNAAALAYVAVSLVVCLIASAGGYLVGRAAA